VTRSASDWSPLAGDRRCRLRAARGEGGYARVGPESEGEPAVAEGVARRVVEIAKELIGVGSRRASRSRYRPNLENDR